MTRNAYLRRVGFALRDVPWGPRRELLTDLTAHLAELPDDTDLVARLGTPAEYAAELRSAAGVERRHGPFALLRARRRRNVVLAVIVLTFVGLLTGGVVWVQSYQPIEWTGEVIYPKDAVRNVNASTETIPFRKGGHFRFAIGISNAGSFTVRIVGLGALAVTQNVDVIHPQLPFTYRLLMSRPSLDWSAKGPYSSFEPFALEPRQGTMLVIDGTFGKSCRPWQPGDATDLEPRGYLFREGFIPIRFHYLWKTSTALVLPPSLLRIRFPKGCQ